MNLTAHFRLEEYCKSDTAARMGREIWPPSADCPLNAAETLENLTRNAELLEAIRAELGEVLITISSGFRPPWLNAAIHGARNSAHTFGCAADCRAAGLTPAAFAAQVYAMRARLPALDQCILEFGRCVHLAVAREGATPRGEFLTALSVDGQTVYRPGLTT